jgi:hypothetical protein
MEWYSKLDGVTFWDLEASSLGPSKIVHVTLNTINGVTRPKLTNAMVHYTFSPNIFVYMTQFGVEPCGPTQYTKYDILLW